jgi:ABC-type dipeptide/oligopeptide/nickel transport system ATPase subunit
MTVLEATGVRVRYGWGAGSTEVLCGVDLVVRPGEIVGLRGPSGCGKSTLLRVLTTVQQATSGELRLGGTPVRGMRRDGYVMPIAQNCATALDPRWPLWRSITEPLTAPHRADIPSASQRRSLASERLAWVGLEGLDVDARPRELSGGQRQRISILRTLLAEPALIVADEPTSALDVSVAAGVIRLFADAASRGTSIVIASHDRNVLGVLCDSVYVLEDGVLAEDAVPVKAAVPG